QLGVEDLQPPEQLLPRFTANAARRRAHPLELGVDAVDQRVELVAQFSAGSGLTELEDHTFQMCRQRRTTLLPTCLTGLTRPTRPPSPPPPPPPATPTARFHSSYTSSTSASQKSIFTGRRREPFR